MNTSPATLPPAPARAPRLSAADWAQVALDVIAEQGVAAVAVEPLARRLGVTKGSFYRHFPSRDALLQAALERWEEVEQQQVFGSLEEEPDPRERLLRLFQLVGHETRPHAIYSELLKALEHPAVAPVIKTVRGDGVFMRTFYGGALTEGFTRCRAGGGGFGGRRPGIRWGRLAPARLLQYGCGARTPQTRGSG